MSTMTRPVWATETIGPDRGGDGVHQAVVTVGNFSLRISQVFDLEELIEPVFCDFDSIAIHDDGGSAQDCRDLAAALLEAARIIEAATS